MIELDQEREYTEDEITLGRCANLLVAALWNKDGTPKDIADKEGRAALIRAVGNIPKEITTNLREEDRKLLNDTIKECQETRKIVKSWFWWIAGAMFLASALVTLCVVMLLR